MAETFRLRIYNWAVLSDEEMSNGYPISLLNDEQMNNWVGVEHQPDNKLRRICFGVFEPFLLGGGEAFNANFMTFAITMTDNFEAYGEGDINYMYKNLE